MRELKSTSATPTSQEPAGAQSAAAWTGVAWSDDSNTVNGAPSTFTTAFARCAEPAR